MRIKPLSEPLALPGLVFLERDKTQGREELRWSGEISIPSRMTATPTIRRQVLPSGLIPEPRRWSALQQSSEWRWSLQKRQADRGRLLRWYLSTKPTGKETDASESNNWKQSWEKFLRKPSEPVLASLRWQEDLRTRWLVTVRWWHVQAKQNAGKTDGFPFLC